MNIIMAKMQPLSAKVGEVSYREKLAAQHLGQVYMYEDEYTRQEMNSVIREKAERHIEDFENLRRKGISLSPFLEIGAGYGQAALILVNKFKARGYAIDLAVRPLKGMRTVAKELKFGKSAKALVCDAEDLPFDDNRFQFVFCYQTLHHFPDPEKVIQEAHRVLVPGGYFFFGEEPVAQTLNWSFWRRPTKLRWWEKFLKATLILIFISRIGKSEVDRGILEEEFSLKTWRKALDIFEVVEAKLTPFPNGVKDGWGKSNEAWTGWSLRSLINRIWIFFLGGGITGWAKKGGDARRRVNLPLPNKKGIEVEGVPVILCRRLLNKLYKSNR